MGNFETRMFAELDEVSRKRWSLVEHYMEPISGLYLEPGVTEIMVNRWDRIFVEKNGVMSLTACRFADEEALKTLIRQIGVVLDQQKSLASGILHARLPDQSRACCTLESVSPYGATLTLRVAPKKHFSMQDLVANNTLTSEAADFLAKKVAKGANIIVSGSTGSGKTTLLRCLADFIDKSERVVTCEDTQELLLSIPNLVSMEAPKRLHDPELTVGLSTLIETALRQNPDRIIVGEIREALAADAFLQAINTGHKGCATSIHANGAVEAIKRIQYLIASGGLLDYDLCGRQLVSSVDLMVHISRESVGKRIVEIAIIRDDAVNHVFKYDSSTDSLQLCEHKEVQ